jgi:hypothetical protein
MAIQFDLIIPPVIVGILTIILFNIHSFMMETSVDNRLNNDMQTFADLATTTLQEELRMIDQIVEFNPDNLRFVTTNRDTVGIRRINRYIEITRFDAATAGRDTLIVSANLSNLNFQLEPVGSPTPSFLRVQVETESRPEHHASLRNTDKTVRAFSERRLFLRNVAVRMNQ